MQGRWKQKPRKSADASTFSLRVHDNPSRSISRGALFEFPRQPAAFNLSRQAGANMASETQGVKRHAERLRIPQLVLGVRCRKSSPVQIVQAKDAPGLWSETRHLGAPSQLRLRRARTPESLKPIGHSQ